MKRFLLIIAFIGVVTTSNAQWQEINGTCGVITCFAVNGNNIFAGTANNGVFYSSNNGSTWVAVNTGLTNSNILSLTINDNTIFAGTPSGVFLSSNNGGSWIAANSGLPVTGIYALASIGNNIFAGMHGNGIYMSSNNGASWANANNPNLNINQANVTAFAVTGDSIYMGTTSGFCLSTNYGSSWTVLTGSNVFAIAANGKNLYYGTQTGMWSSSNNGSTWTGTPFLDVSSLLISGDNVYAGRTHGGGVYMSSDSGSTWVALNNGLINDTVTALAACGNNIYAGTRGGIYMSTDNGNTWIPVNTGVRNTNIKTLALKDTKIFAGSYGGGVYLSSNDGGSWTTMNNGLTGYTVNALAINDSNIYAAISGYGVFLSTDNGSNWAYKGLQNIYLTSIATKGSKIFIGGTNIYFSSNNGNNWSNVSNGFISNWTCLSIAIKDSNIFAGMVAGGVNLSTNDGLNWSAINTGITTYTILSAYVHALAVDDSSIFAGTQNHGSGTQGGIYLSTNNGNNWTEVSTGVTNKNITALCIKDSSLFAGTQNGVFMTTNSGASWTDVSIGLTNKNINTLAINDNFIYAGINGGGVWKRALSDFAIDTTSTNVVSLEQNNILFYPNPANSELTLEIPAYSYFKNTTLEIFDIEGRLIDKIQIQDIKTQINISRLFSGIYFFRITNNQGVLVKKIIKE